MTITIDVLADVVDRLTRKAAEDGQDVTEYVQSLAVHAAGTRDASTLAAWDALLDSFSEGDEEDHRDTVATLARALNEDRPGQRRVFGEGINPASSVDQAA